MGLIDPMLRHELTGPWAGFGFQAGHFWTPEGLLSAPFPGQQPRYPSPMPGLW